MGGKGVPSHNLVQLLGRNAQIAELMFGASCGFSAPEELEQKNKAQRVNHLSEPNFSSAPEDPGTEIGARPLQWCSTSLLKNKLKLHKKIPLLTKSYYL